MTGALVEDLFAEPGGRVVAVAVRRGDGTRETIGCGALVLACNGFGGNPEMVRRFIPEIADAEYFGHPGNRGDAVDWGTALGAATADMGAYHGHGSVTQPHGVLLTWAVVTEGGFQVNLAGKRFANEASGYSEFAVAVQRQPGKVAWSMCDARCEAPALGFEGIPRPRPARRRTRGGHLAELARVTGLPRGALEETFADVAACAAGRRQDAFGRDFTVKPPLAPPYRAVRTAGTLFHTQGGLVVNETVRVLRPDGTKLPNVFAEGGAARGVSGPSSWGYLAGNGLRTAIVLGRLAGLASGGASAGRTSAG
jgi:fumarate reductase flavoprotein subunit